MARGQDGWWRDEFLVARPYPSDATAQLRPALTMRRRLRHSFTMLVYFWLMLFFSLTDRRSPFSRSDLSLTSSRLRRVSVSSWT